MEDDILHFFLYCPRVAFFWTTLKRWLKNVIGLSIDEEIEEGLLFNNPGKIVESKIENFILLNVKFYIYRQRLFHNNHLNVLEWALEFREKLRIEKQICSQEGKLRKFKIWEKILEKMS